ncbi:integrase [Natrinema mahii]|nr:integrase [Natrinema mahii]
MTMNRNDTGQFGLKYDLDEEHTEYFDEYGEWVTINVDKQTTIDRLKSGVRVWLHWCQKHDVNPYEATERDVRLFIKSMQHDELAETTITRRVATVSKYYHFLATDPVIEVEIENPTKNISLPKDYDIKNLTEYVRVLDDEGRDDIIALDYKQIEPIFDYVPGKKEFTRVRNKLICHLFWQTAVRSDELSRFREDNIDWENREIKIRSSKLNRKDHPDLYHRRVWWEPNLDYLMRRWESKRSQVDPSGECPYWLISETGNQLSPSYLSRIVKDAADNAGVNEPLVRGEDGEVQQWLYTGHRLRHSRISHLANETDLDLNFIRMMAGHAKMDTTLKYVETNWGAARNAFEDATHV